MSSLPPLADDDPPADRVLVDHLVDEVVSLVRLMHALKAQNTSRSSTSLLIPLVRSGPQRLTALAEAVHADPSTVSRQVAELVRDGLVRREADPDDGRASLLVVTGTGHEAASALRAERQLAVARALAGWTPDDISACTASLRRFTADVGASLGVPASPLAAAACLPTDQTAPSLQETA